MPILGHLVLLLSPVTAAQESNACAPAGYQLPSFSILRGPTGPARALLRVDASLVGGQAVLLLEGEPGRPLPPGGCTHGLRGCIIGLRPVRPGGRAGWLTGQVPVAGWPRVRALAWPAGGSWDDVHVSNLLAAPGPGGASGCSKGMVLTEIQKDPTVVPDSLGEWLEVTNIGPVTVDLEGWTLADHGGDHAVLEAGGAGILVHPGQAVVLGREVDPVLNGGIQVDVAYAGMILGNGVDEVLLVRPDGSLADQVIYDDGHLWPDEPGRSISLDPSQTDAGSNDDGESWCPAYTPIGGGPDCGTPGVANKPCTG